MKNWKTTIGGILAATGTAMQASDNQTVKVLGYVLGGIGLLLLGGAAKDKNVTGGSTQQ
jgi:poly(3-hydroxyalkanoate) synthetase